jgi:hypothetical protein
VLTAHLPHRITLLLTIDHIALADDTAKVEHVAGVSEEQERRSTVGREFGCHMDLDRRSGVEGGADVFVHARKGNKAHRGSDTAVQDPHFWWPTLFGSNRLLQLAHGSAATNGFITGSSAALTVGYAKRQHGTPEAPAGPSRQRRSRPGRADRSRLLNCSRRRARGHRLPPAATSRLTIPLWPAALLRSQRRRRVLRKSGSARCPSRPRSAVRPGQPLGGAP